MATIVDFWFDPVCPWAWITSRWMLEVEQVRDVKVCWHVMSLSLLNSDRDVSDDYRALMDRALGPVRVCIAVEQHHGNEALGPLYTAFGQQFHHEQKDPDRAAIEAALAAAGLPVALAAAAGETAYDDALRASHDEGMALVGLDVGTPIIRVGESSFFGPVVTPVPRGDDAARLWDGVLLVASVSGFYELKRSRDERPAFD